ncbi:MAG: TIGR03936 family radical SAM-associated protein [Planctomycetales bacterium]|nr:TIGR03936 family radical SAM-associated protein [Planctomycetales bacterium]MCA9171228.1 TIGR03936 family radical SAM-associated protein [Planctomycetales bacterium]
MSRQKLRIRFRKFGDLRLISHRDLARAFERLFRRACLPLAMSEGFHPHPRINFPSALALGIQGEAEWVEALLAEPVSEEAARMRLVEHSPEGLEITDVRTLDVNTPKPQVDRADYEIPLPSTRSEAAQQAIVELLGKQEYLIERDGRSVPINLRDTLVSAQVNGDRLRFTLSAVREAQARPREILEALGLGDLESHGLWLTRTAVHLTAPSSRT